ncbi:hypothetical protein CAPTEDRAFT_210872 [Capitella teleta]|uniref:Sulfotransferase domain-containing protein n=1 Tax=Capitella teleta TaxID=283909 RepID=R7TYP2_CAPTE|nr:hypothetical protein CAPTEDRAFT_210872 [Capitella teleta]|eukprot:ELT98829.1 hypothetical protein CAPTEDRAFT_210872 [Capitella teleta]
MYVDFKCDLSQMRSATCSIILETYRRAQNTRDEKTEARNLCSGSTVMFKQCLQKKKSHGLILILFFMVPILLKISYVQLIVKMKQRDATAEIQRARISSQNHTIKVYLFTYMRGGSSLGGTLFNQDPRGLLWYEPLDQFFMAYLGHARWGLPMHVTMNKDNYTQRTIPQEEHSLYVNYISNMLSCNYQSLPAETFTHIDFIGQSRALKFMNSCTGKSGMVSCKKNIKARCGSASTHIRDPAASWKNSCPQIIKALDTVQPSAITTESFKNELKDKFQMDTSTVDNFIDHRTCMENVKSKVKSCMEKALSKCHEQKIHAVEVLRSNMAALDDVIKRLPDLYVVHYVRDPRAIAQSTIKVKFNSGDIVHESRLICNKMEQDIKDYERLSSLYPGVFIRVKYEDLVFDPKQFGKTVYQHIGLKDCSTRWLKTVQSSLHGSKASGSFGTFRKNGTEAIEKWRKQITDQKLNEVNRICKNVLNALGYSL